MPNPKRAKNAAEKPMREQLARALAVGFDDPRTHDDNGIQIITGRENGFGLADIALAIMLKPTKKMIAALDPDIHPSWLGHRAYEMIVRAAKDGK